MKSTVCLVFMLFLSIAHSAISENAVSRERSLDGVWRFASAAQQSADEWTTIPVPSNWNTYTEYADYIGGILGSNKGKGEVGTAESLAHYGKCWANVSDVPFQKYKGMVHEGGISTPLIAHWPKGIDASLNGKLAHDPAHLIDLMASFVDITSASYPATFNGHEIIPMEGESLVPVFQGKALERKNSIFFEHVGNRAVRQGKWKLVAIKGKPWELYDMEADRTELNNLATEMPEKVEAMVALYRAWAKRAFVNKIK
jgi:arylsulfatase A-like enzyme